VGDVTAMAQGALSLLNDRKRLETMREAGRQTAQNRFCSSLVVPHYVRYYQQVLEKQGIGSREQLSVPYRQDGSGR
jgi:hypothetical protein